MPETAYEVHLEMFEGPLDLLLFLIKKDDLDIYNIPVSHITQEYLAYLEMMKELNLEVAGEFLVLASSLLAIKAKTLLPSQESEEAEGPDPRAELVAKLLEYQKFKEASKFLEARGEQFKDVFYRGTPHFDDSEKSLSIGSFELLSALKDILERADDEAKEVVGEEFPIEEKMKKVLFLLDRHAGVLSWEELFADERKRRGIIACFLALLELVKLQKIFVRQEENFGKIAIYTKVPQIFETESRVEEGSGDGREDAGGSAGDGAGAAGGGDGGGDGNGPADAGEPSGGERRAEAGGPGDDPGGAGPGA